MNPPTLGQQLIQLKTLLQQATGCPCESSPNDLLVLAAPLLAQIQQQDNIRVQNLLHNATPILHQIQEAQKRDEEEADRMMTVLYFSQAHQDLLRARSERVWGSV